MSSTRNERKRSRAQVQAEEDPSPISYEDRDNGAVQKKKRAKVDPRSLFVRSLPPGVTNESLTTWFSEHYPVKHATVVIDPKTKESRGFGFVTLADADDALEAKKALDKKSWDGRRIRIDIAEPRHRNSENAPTEAPVQRPKMEDYHKAPKLIIRNLPWSIKTSEQLSQIFRSFGLVKFADLPQSHGKLKGFGFVTIRGKPNAERALQAINGKEIDGRTLAVDWAVDKETWDKSHPKKEEEQEAKTGKAAKAKVDDDEDEDEDVDEEADDDEDVDEDLDEDLDEDEDEDTLSEEGGAKVTPAKPSRDEGLDADLENFMKNHMQNLEDEEDEDDDEKSKPAAEPVRKAPARLTTDNSSTLFIRNMPFTTTDEQLKGFFEKFGAVRYGRVVVDKATEKPAGTGFVCFYNAEDAKACIIGAPRSQQPPTSNKTSILQDESADPDGKYTLDGRLLQVVQAVNKQQASNLADNSLASRNLTDKRRLYLLPEGIIDRNSPLFDVLSPTELQTRQASAAQRRKMVQGNPSLHISLTRLALRNIPRNIGAKELKELARKAVVGFAKDVKEGRRLPLSKEENARDGKDGREKDQERRAKGKGIVRQAKVIYETAQGTKITETPGGGRSRGYGFIEYTSHHWALMGLRFLNGHQLENENGKKQRMVVEFAIENAQVVHRRKAAEEKSRQIHEPGTDANAGAMGQRIRKDSTSFNKDKDSDKSKGKGKKGKKGSKPAAVVVPEKVVPKKPVDPKEEMKQTLIQRKRVMRKKKAAYRKK
ncbi:hypothetical protein G7046_g6596 [Stylonectria norvegica]|nr:hypothetical protein G7046_g6596 [Stylonectria norvegica]